jgi:hypothetical protein
MLFRLRCELAHLEAQGVPISRPFDFAVCIMAGPDRLRSRDHGRALFADLHEKQGF